MKVALIRPRSSRTGEYRYGELLINSLKDNGFEIEIINNLILTKHPLKVFIGSVFFKRLMSKKNISIVHNLDNIGPFLFNNSIDAKKISNVWDLAPIVLPDIHNWRIKFDFKLLNRLIKNTDFIISPSNSTTSDLINKLNVDSGKIETIPLGIDFSVFRPISGKEEILEHYALDKDYILYTGTANPRKNLVTLIHAYVNIINDISQDLVIVGPVNKSFIVNIIKGYVKSEYSLKEILDRIKILGYIKYEDLPVIYSSATIFIFPSLYEGFGLPPLEAMACGTPVIASYNSSLKEVLGKSGFYLQDPQNSLELSKKIKIILDDKDLQIKMKNLGLNQAKNFNWDKTAENTVKFYEKIL